MDTNPKAIDSLKELYGTLDLIQTLTKEIYKLLIPKTLTRPKIITNNPLTCFKNSFYNTTNAFLSPVTKEHFLFSLHNILRTADTRDKCTVADITSCLPAVITRILTTINPDIKNIKMRDLMFLNFKLKDKKKHNTAVWLLAYFGLALWEARTSKEIIEEIIAVINYKSGWQKNQ